MSSQKSTLLTTVVALGFVTATVTAAAMVYTNSREQQTSDTAAADLQRSAMDKDEVGGEMWPASTRWGRSLVAAELH